MMIPRGSERFLFNKGNNKITEFRTIFQRESKNSSAYKQTKSVNNRKKQSVPVSPALYHGIFMLKSNADTPIELDTIMCAN